MGKQAGVVLSIMLRTQDPEQKLDNNFAPALTSLLHRVCDGSQLKFDEACRLVELFVVEALKENSNK